MEYPTPPLSHVEWLYIQWTWHYTGPLLREFVMCLTIPCLSYCISLTIKPFLYSMNMLTVLFHSTTTLSDCILLRIWLYIYIYIYIYHIGLQVITILYLQNLLYIKLWIFSSGVEAKVLILLTQIWYLNTSKRKENDEDYGIDRKAKTKIKQYS